MLHVTIEMRQLFKTLTTSLRCTACLVQLNRRENMFDHASVGIALHR